VPQPGNPIAWNRFAYVYNNPVNYTDPSGHIPAVLGAAYTVVDTAWDAVDLYSDVRDCLGDSDSMACAMLPIDALAVVALFAEGPSNNVARRAAKAADAGDAAKYADEIDFRKVYDNRLPKEVRSSTTGKMVERTNYETRFNAWAKERKIDLTQITEPRRHHGLPQEHELFFEDAGIDIHDPANIYLLPNKKHGRLPDGIHTTAGNNAVDWNVAWDRWIYSHPGATAEQIYDRLEIFEKSYGITQYRAGRTYFNTLP